MAITSLATFIAVFVTSSFGPAVIVDEGAAGGPVWFGNIATHHNYQVTNFPALRVALDVGLADLSGEDETNDFVFSDHTAALTGNWALLPQGQATQLRIGIGGSLAGLTCPWDCAPTPDLLVGTADLLAVLTQWGTAGECDFDGNGVGTADLLAVLQNWGGCQ